MEGTGICWKNLHFQKELEALMGKERFPLKLEVVEGGRVKRSRTCKALLYDDPLKLLVWLFPGNEQTRSLNSAGMDICQCLTVVS